MALNVVLFIIINRNYAHKTRDYIPNTNYSLLPKREELVSIPGLSTSGDVDLYRAQHVIITGM